LSLERIFKALVDLGLSEPDARVYIFLALNGPKDAKILIEKLKISQQQILQSLRNLKNEEIILTDNKNRKIFSALPFEKALKLLIKTEREQTKTVQKNLLHKWNAMMKKDSTNSK
jgi:sugar-specific transcriptional regulator TrmB